MNEKEKHTIIDKIKELEATNPCSRCGHNDFALSDKYLLFVTSDEPDRIDFGLSINVDGQVSGIPTVIITCKHCGCISLHSLTILKNSL